MQQNIQSVSQAIHHYRSKKMKRRKMAHFLPPKTNSVLSRRQTSKTQVNIVHKLEINMLAQNLYQLLQSLQLEIYNKREVI